MSTNTDTEPPADPAEAEPEPQKSFWAGFSWSDWRTLVVTVAGTVIGGILLVIVVGVAVIVARRLPSSPHGGVPAENLLILGGLSALAGFTAIAFSSAAPGVRPPSWRELPSRS